MRVYFLGNNCTVGFHDVTLSRPFSQPLFLLPRDGNKYRTTLCNSNQKVISLAVYFLQKSKKINRSLQGPLEGLQIVEQKKGVGDWRRSTAMIYSVAAK